MHVSTVSVRGEDFVGLYGVASDKYQIVSPELKGTQVLDVPILKTKLYGTHLVGLFAAGNSNGLLVPYFVSDSEMDKLNRFSKKHGFNVEKLSTKYTALGNMIVANDNAAIISENIREDKRICDTLDVEVIAKDISGHQEVGTRLVATNKGYIAAADAQEELTELEHILKVPGQTGTVNRGIPYVKSGLIANSKGYITGSLTTGIELQRIDDALGFY